MPTDVPEGAGGTAGRMRDLAHLIFVKPAVPPSGRRGWDHDFSRDA